MRFYVNDQKLQISRSLPLVSDTMNYLEAELFIQGDGWDGLEKWLHFRQGETIYDFKLDGENKITQSAGLNLPAGQWEVYLHGERKSGGTVVQRVTTDCCLIDVQQFGQMDGVEGPIPTEEANDYLKEESERVADLVMDRQTENTFSLAFLCDMHCGTEYQEADGKYVVDDTAVEDAGEALRLLLARCPLDAVVLGGDLSAGSWKCSNARTKKELSDCGEYLYPGNGQPVLYLQGNHDDAPYMATEERLTATELYAWFNRKNMLSGAVLHEGNLDGNYGYVDFEAQKVRVIYLNTDEKPSWESEQVGTGGENNYLNAGNMTTEQLDFLANTALDFSEKDSAAQWSIIVCSHRPLNEGAGTYLDYESNITNAVVILDAYLSGGNGVISHNGVEMSYNYSALTEKAKLLCCVHGHNHKYSHEWLGSGILSVGCPNAMNGRERVSDNGFVYTKAANTAKSTAFCVITVDKESGKVYADHYGSGYDRQWQPGAEDVPEEEAVNLIPLSIDTDGSIYNGAGYALNTRLDSGGNAVSYDNFATTGFMPCELGDTVYLQNIRMEADKSDSSNLRISFYNAAMEHLGQTNATGANSLLNAVYGEDGNISEFTVKNFSGNDLSEVCYFRLCSTQLDGTSVVSINAKADTEEPEENIPSGSYTNQITLSVDSDGSVYNGVGYKANTRLNSGGVAADYDGYICTGFIPCELEDVVYLQNIRMEANESDSANLRISFYNSAKEHIGQTNATGANGLLDAIYGSDGNMTQFTVKEFSGNDFSDLAYFRLCSTALDGSSVITINELIA